MPEALAKRLGKIYPGLRVAGAVSPPFRPLTPEEDEALVAQINAAKPDFVWVGLGAPQQDLWVASHRSRLNAAALLAVGAAFDFLSGSKRQATRWMMRCGLEWAFRLASEPRRLAWRYLKHNPRFVIQFVWQLIARSRRKYSAADTREDFAGPRNRLP